MVKGSSQMAKVLIVEDEVLVAEAMSHFLDHAGHNVLGIAKDAVSALSQAAAEHPDVVLMDVRLAGTSDGIATAHKMQAQQRVEVVFVTAYGDARTRARAAAVQPAGFLLKPFSSEELLNAVARAERRQP
jgi:1,2-diacylglycerol 3-beta-glucosyltransferase